MNATTTSSASTTSLVSARQAIIGERYKVIWQRPVVEKWYMSSFSDRFTPAQKKAFFPSAILRQREGRQTSSTSRTMERGEKMRPGIQVTMPGPMLLELSANATDSSAIGPD